jgi:DNA replication and repair protein RecF
VLRAGISAGERRRLVETEMRSGGPTRVLVDRSPLARRRDLAEVLRVTVFSPDDLELVKGSPTERREFLDDLLVSISPRHDAARSDYERVLKQRNALLKSRRLDAEGVATLDVFDVQLSRAGAELVRGRLNLVSRLLEPLGEVYGELSSRTSEVHTAYVADWCGAGAERDEIEGGLAAALQSARSRDMERGVTSVGPHRDEWRLGLGGRDARTQASQGEQRSLALAMRLAGHLVVREVTGITPVLLLDDVFSELDAARSEALVAQLPAGQALLTTAARVPDVVEADRVLRLAGHRLVEAA